MPAATITTVTTEARRVIRHLPEAHSWWAAWHEAKFRGAVRGFEERVFQIDVRGLSDEQLDAVERAVRMVIKAVQIHVAALQLGVMTEGEWEFYRTAVHRLEMAATGFEEGLPPDGKQRPGTEGLLEEFAELLRVSPLNLPAHTD